MRAVHLVEEERKNPDLPVFGATPNRAIFGATVNRTLCAVYRDNSKQFSTMITDQGKPYWIKFCVTLKSVLEKEGYGVKYVKTDVNYFEDFFIELVKVLAINKVEGIQALVNKIVSIASSGQLFRAAGIYEDNVEFKSSYLTSLFGTDFESPYIKVWVTIPLFLRAIGGLLKIFEMWLSAEPTGQIKWEQPDSWELCDTCMPWRFEIFLRSVWGKKLLKFFNCKTPDDLGWFDDDEFMYDEDDSFWLSNLNGSQLSGGIVEAVMTALDKVHKYIESGSGVKLSTPQKEKFHLYHMYLNFPRGIEVLLCLEGRLPSFMGSSSRELFLFNSSEVFHPYSQFKILFWNTAYNAKFWKIVDNQLKGLPEPSKVSRTQRDNNYMDHIMHVFLATNETRTAISMDSLFHDFSSLDTTWESPDVTVRLLWNMPLCLNWLEILLLRIYEFEAYFLPFVHYPVGKSVKRLAEDVYVKHCKLSRFLVKTAIVIAENIYSSEDSDPGRCLDARSSLKFAISMLVSRMKFFNGPAYQILELIASKSYKEKEWFNDKSYSLGPKRVFVDLDSASEIPDFDLYFNTNYRSVYHDMLHAGIRRLRQPQNDASAKCYTKALEMLQDYEKHVKMNGCNYQYKKVSDALYTYDPQLNYVINMGTFRALCPEVMTHPVRLLVETIDFISYIWLREKGDLSDKLLKDLKKPATRNSSSDSDNENDVMVPAIVDLTKLAQVFLVCTAVLGITTSNIVPKPNQILLSRLKHAECRATISDTVSRFIRMVIQHTYPQFKPHPNHTTLSDVEDIFKDRCLEKVTIPEALKLLENAEQIYNVDVSTLPPLQVPSWSNFTYENSLTINVCKLYDELSDFRYRLLHEISEKQFCNTKAVSRKSEDLKSVTFKYLDVLEYRFVEEMAALKTASKLKEIDVVVPSRLASLLKFRAEWLLKEFTEWCSSQMSVVPVSSVHHTSTYETAISVWTRTTAVLIQLQSLFQVYLSHDYTVHPVTESTVDILVQGQKKFLTLLQNRELRKTVTEAMMSSYYVAMEHLGIDYLSNLLDHCILVWNVPKFCVDPMQQVVLFSLQHAEKIYTALLHFFLFFSHTLLSKCRRFDALKLIGNMAKKFVKAKVLLHTAAMDDTVDWDETCCRLQTIYLTVASFILLNVDHKDPHLKCVPCWKGYVEAYKPLYETFIEDGSQESLNCLGLEEFLCKVFKENSSGDVNGKVNDFNTTHDDYEDNVTCETKVVKLRQKFRKNGETILEETVYKTTTHIENCDCNIPGKKHLLEKENSDPASHVENCDLEELSKSELKKLKKKAKKERYKLNKKSAKAQQNTVSNGDTTNVLCVSTEKSNAENVLKTEVSADELGEVPAEESKKVKTVSEENVLTVMEREMINTTEDVKEEVNNQIGDQTEKTPHNLCNVHTEFKDTQTSDGCCYSCGDIEQREQPFRKCVVCVMKQWNNKRLYCSSNCQVTDWKKHHLLEHSNWSNSAGESHKLL